MQSGLWYWSSTTHANNPAIAWCVYFYDGYVGYGDKGVNEPYAWCVRDGQ